MPRDPFDPVAATYDDQRGLPPAIGDELCLAVLERAPNGQDARFFEVGVGTGRIAASFLRAGCVYTGIDLSPAMLTRGRDKRGSARLSLVRGDMLGLPLPDSIFDVAIAASVFRVVRPWQVAAREVARVLTRPGLVVLVRHELEPGSLDDALAREKRGFLTRIGVGAAPRGGAEDAEVAAFFAAQGATVESSATAWWETVTTPRACIARHLTGNRVAGQPWAGELTRALETFAVERSGSLDAAEPVRRRLLVSFVRLASEATTTLTPRTPSPDGGRGGD